MSEHSIAAATEARLARYTTELDPGIVAEVAAIAAVTHDLDAEEIIGGIHPIDVTRLAYGDAAPAVVMDVRPRQDYDERDALLVFMPIAATHTEYQQLRTALLARLFPDRRIVVVANTNGTDAGPKLTNDEERRRVVRGDFGPLLDPVLDYLHTSGVETISAIGCSFGAELVSRLPAFAHNHLLDVRHVLAVEPPGVVATNIIDLAISLMRSGLQSRPFIQAVTSPAYRELLQRETDFWRVARGVTALDTVAAAGGIARGQFEAWMDLGLRLYPDMSVTLAAGDLSLLSPGQVVSGVGAALRARHGARVKNISLGQHGHAVITDAPLVGALARQALRPRISQAEPPPPA